MDYNIQNVIKTYGNFLRDQKDFLQQGKRQGYETMAVGQRISTNGFVKVIATYNSSGRVMAYVSEKKEFKPIINQMDPLFQDYNDPEEKVGPAYLGDGKHNFKTTEDFQKFLDDKKVILGKK